VVSIIICVSIRDPVGRCNAVLDFASTFDDEKVYIDNLLLNLGTLKTSPTSSILIASLKSATSWKARDKNVLMLAMLMSEPNARESASRQPARKRARVPRVAEGQAHPRIAGSIPRAVETLRPRENLLEHMAKGRQQ